MKMLYTSARDVVKDLGTTAARVEGKGFGCYSRVLGKVIGYCSIVLGKGFE